MILAFDTSGPYCAAALRDGDRLFIRVEPMKTGQADRLMPLLEELLAEAGASWSDLSRIGVGIGPGNFTGIRIAVSAARGLALALKVPAVGVDAFEAIEATTDRLGVPAVPAPRGQAYLRDSRTRVPYLASTDELSDLMQDGPLLTPDPDDIAIGIARAAAAKAPGPRPAPLYVKPADAAPASDPPPVILDANDA